MKFFASDYGFNNQSHQKTKVPVWTTVELGKEFGVTPQQLARFLRSDETAPKPIYRCENDRAVQKHHRYDPVAVRKWWKKRNAI